MPDMNVKHVGGSIVFLVTLCFLVASLTIPFFTQSLVSSVPIHHMDLQCS